MSWLGKLAKVALPIVGGLTLGPLGAMAGGALSGAAGGGGAGGAGGGLLKTVGGFLGKNPELIGAGLGLLQGNKDQNAANKAYKKQEQFAMQRWNDTAPLRSMALQGLQNQQRPDLSRIFVNPQNPFSDNRAAPLPAVGGLPLQAAQAPALGGGGAPMNRKVYQV